jgi:hypothetical protein
MEDAIHFERHLAEPADVGTNPSSAFATGNLGWRIVGVGVAERRSAAPVAAAFEEFAVVIRKLEETEKLIKELKKALSR